MKKIITIILILFAFIANAQQNTLNTIRTEGYSGIYPTTPQKYVTYVDDTTCDSFRIEALKYELLYQATEYILQFITKNVDDNGKIINKKRFKRAIILFKNSERTVTKLQ